MPDAPRVFISYSHDSDEHETRVLEFANRLRDEGIDAEVDQYETSPDEGWPTWCEQRIKQADFVLLVCTETYLRRFDDADPGEGRGVLWEARTIRQLIYDDRAKTGKYIPVLFGGGSPDHIPLPVKGATRWEVDKAGGYERLYRQLTRQPSFRKPIFGKFRPMPPRESRPGLATETQPPPAPAVGAKRESPRLLERKNEITVLAVAGGTAAMRSEREPVRIFYSYSHADEALLNKLRLHLASLRRRGLIEEWHDRAIDAGTKWADEIERNLRSANLVLLLISHNFIASDFCYGKEMTAALERHERGEARVVPIILSACRWLKLPFARLQAVPRDNRAVTSSYWVNVDEALDEVAGGIEEIVEAMCAAPAPMPEPSTVSVQRTTEQPKQSNGVGIGVDPSLLGDLAVFKDMGAPWCPEMVVIPSGSFLMGSPPDEPDRSDNEEPQHRVTICRRFALGRYAVTFSEYDHFCEATNRQMLEDHWGRSRQPVVGVSWRDAIAYVEWLCADTCRSYRLPTEAEWEYACRAGITTPFSFGRRITPEQANNGRKKAIPVGSLLPNPWGLHDMHGNVWEWVEDLWHNDYLGAPVDGSGWTQDEARPSHRVIRGGSWRDNSCDLRSAVRSVSWSVDRSNNVGFRIARALY